MSSDLDNAPPPVTVAGQVAVPMDIHQVVATLTFDAAAQVATAQAAVTFTVGDTAGHPIFDLRQQITSASLDGAPIAPGQLAHQDLGGGVGAKLRVIGTTLAAGSIHTLALSYTLGTPDAANARPIGWDAAAQTVSFDFWMSDLYAGRYLEMWLPANLIFDQFAVDLTLEIVGSPTTHVVWTNGFVSPLGSNHWHISYPATGTSLSPMLVLLPAGLVQTRISAVTVPGRPAPVAIELLKKAANPVNLAATEAQLSAWLIDNETTTGPYVHGDRFVAYLWDEPSRSMEYDGGTTSNAASLQHETFHSWYGRGVKPASQADGWIDEAWTTYVTGGGIPQAFVAGDPPVQLCTRNAFTRITAAESYVDGARFFAGLAAALGEPALRAAMSAFYQNYRGRLVTTSDLEAWLILRTGILDIAHWFHRWVYGFGDPATGQLPDLALLDAVGDPGDNQYTGAVFWNSPDIWTRIFDDGGTAPQNPEYGQDNWLYARVHNRGVGRAASFIVTWNVKPWAGTEFRYPADYAPPVAVAIGFDLSPGQTKVLRARWPAGHIPTPGTHACCLASVSTARDTTVTGQRVWESNNLAQRNLTIVDVLPDATVLVPFRASNWLRNSAFEGTIELRRAERLSAGIVHAGWPTNAGRPNISRPAVIPQPGAVVDFAPTRTAQLPFNLPARVATPFALRLTAPTDAKPGDEFDVDLIQREKSGKATGGISVRMRIV